MPTKAKPKFPVSERAIVQRINRKLKSEGWERLKKCPRSRSYWNEFGDYYTIDLNRNFVTGTRIHLESYAKELGVIDAWEQVVDDE